MSGFSYRDTELNTIGNISVLRALNGKEIHFNRKRKFFGDPPKPDTPPVSIFDVLTRLISIYIYIICHFIPKATPYWNNPIWNGDISSSPVNVSLCFAIKFQFVSTVFLDNRYCFL